MDREMGVPPRRGNEAQLKKRPENKYVRVRDRLQSGVHSGLETIYKDEIVLNGKSVQNIIDDLTIKIDELNDSLKWPAKHDKDETFRISHKMEVLRNIRRVCAILHGERDGSDKNSEDPADILVYITTSKEVNGSSTFKDNLANLQKKTNLQKRIDTIGAEYKRISEILQAASQLPPIDSKQKTAYELLYSKREAFTLLQKILQESRGDTAFSDVLKLNSIVKEFCESVKTALLFDGAFEKKARRQEVDNEIKYQSLEDFKLYIQAITGTVGNMLREELKTCGNTPKSLETILNKLQSIQVGKTDLKKYIDFALANALPTLKPIIEASQATLKDAETIPAEKS